MRSNDKDTMAFEKQAIGEAKLDGACCCNNPPSVPYFVESEEDIVAELVDPVDFDEKQLALRLDLDVQVEIAAMIPPQGLACLLTATINGNCTKFIDVDVAGEDLEIGGRCAMRPKASVAWKEAEDGVHELDVENLRSDDIAWNPVVVLRYPLGAEFSFEVPLTARNGTVTVGEIVWAICQAYRLAYSDPKKFGVWGHALGDLVIEYIYLDTQAAIIVPGIGS